MIAIRCCCKFCPIHRPFLFRTSGILPIACHRQTTMSSRDRSTKNRRMFPCRLDPPLKPRGHGGHSLPSRYVTIAKECFCESSSQRNSVDRDRRHGMWGRYSVGTIAGAAAKRCRWKHCRIGSRRGAGPGSGPTTRPGASLTAGCGADSSGCSDANANAAASRCGSSRQRCCACRGNSSSSRRSRTAACRRRASGQRRLGLGNGR